MIDLFGQEPSFVAPPVQILVGTTYVKLRISKSGMVGNGVSLAPFMTQFLKEREWIPRFSAYVTISNYSIYDEKTGFAILPRHVLGKLTEFLDSHLVAYTLVDVEPVKPRAIKLKLKKQFAPRDNQPQIIEFMASNASFKPISAQTGIGKQCTNSTPIKIPGGWTTHGTVKVGDIITAWDGTSSVVNGVFPQGLQDVFRVHFSDGRFVDVGAMHLWTILCPSEKTDILESRVCNTLELLEKMQDTSTAGNTYIPLCESELIKDIPLPADPYSVGVLLGNMRADATKCIPPVFLNASHDQRLALLRGLLDFHGVISPIGSIQFATASMQLASDVQFLIRSIGGICGIFLDGKSNAVNQIYNLDIRYRYPALLFSVKEKRDLLSGMDQYEQNRKLQIVAVTPLDEKEECTCVSIDHPDQLYVIKDFIVTHNTFCSEAAICELGVATLIVLGSLIDQWYKSLRLHTNIASHEIYVVQGFEPLRKLWEAITNGYRPKIVIFSTRTLVAYAVNPKGQYETIPSYAKLQEVLGFGFKIIDEVHWGFHANTRIDMMSNIRHNVYLSATYERTGQQGGRIFDLIIPKSLRFGEEFQKKFTTVHMLRYQLGIPIADSQKMRTPKGYNHALYENYLRRRREYFEQFMQKVVLPIFRMYYLTPRKPGQILLILCQTRKFALHMENYLKKYIPNGTSMAVYFSGEKGKNGADRNLLCDVIISTHKSCGTGRDIKNLKTCLNTVSFASSPLSGQVLGRLREIPDEETIFVDIWNSEIGSHYGHHNDRMEVYKTKALSFYEGILC